MDIFVKSFKSIITTFGIIILFIGISCTTEVRDSDNAEEAVWTIKMFSKDQENWLSVENKTLYVDFWLAVLPDRSELEGDLQKRIQGRISLGRDIKSIIFYSNTNTKGVTLAYPRVYKGAGKLEVE